MQDAPPLRFVRLIVVAMMLLATTAAAEPRRTTERVTLRARAGERQKAVVNLPAGVVVTVIEEQGRWLKVRVGSGRSAKVGWLTRTTITAPASSAPLVDDRAPSAAWDDATTGGATAAPERSMTPRVVSAQPVRPPQGLRRGLELSATAALGYRSLDMRFASDGSGGLANYLISADAAVADVEVELRARPARALVIGADVRVRGSYSSPGLAYRGPTLPPGDIPFSMFEVEGGARGGWQRGAAAITLRAGVHYGAFLAEEVANPGRLPRERLLGVTAGAGVTVAPRRARARVDVFVDLMVAGDRRQTPGLEDGMTSEAGALWGGASLRYRFDPRWSAVGALRISRAATSWQGASVRQPDVMSAERVDESQIFELGVAAEL